MEDLSMKIAYRLLAFISVTACILSACVEENLEQAHKPAEIGDEISFGVRAGFEDADQATKTAYGTPYTDENGKKFHPIQWINGDLIEIYSPEAEGINPSCYRITTANVPNPEKGKDYATITRNNPEGSLQWSDDGIHNFYAMYPSSDTFKSHSDETLKNGVKMDRTIVNGIVTDEQIPAKITHNGKAWIAEPNMDYAYMVAHNTGNREDGVIPLSFYPIVTAVEIQMNFTKPEDTSDGEDITEYDKNIAITHVMVSSEATITGAFTCDLSTWENKSQYPTCTGTSLSSYTPNSIRIPIWYDKTPDDGNTSYDAVVVEDGGSLTFTVFLLPNSGTTDILDNLSVSVSTNGGSAYVGKDLPGIEIKKNLKNRIINLALPTFSNKTKLNVGNWITQLEQTKPDISIVGLSIPGTGGSFSYGGGAEGYAQQSSNMNIDAQWNIGIRAFEIVSDRPNYSTSSLAGEVVKCNKQEMSNNGVKITVVSAIKDLIERVKEQKIDPEGNPIKNNEFAVAILTYQPEGNYPRNAAAYAKSLKLMFDTSVEEGGLNDYVEDGTIILFEPDLKITDVKNKLMILCRINQEGEGEPINTDETSRYPTLNTDYTAANFEIASKELAGYPVLLINGCGTAKDKWARRGYYIGNTPADNSANYNIDFDPNKNVESYIVGNVTYSSDRSDAVVTYNYIDDSNVTNSGTPDFNYPTNNATCWFQEWARVSPGDGNEGPFKVENKGEHYNYWITQGWRNGYAYRWNESYKEKYNHVTSTFNMAINNQLEGKIVINSLCGYYIATGTNYNQSYIPYGDSSYEGGTNGDIKGLATDLNRDFYQYILNSSLNETSGPTGIVMMDFVSNNSADGGSYYIPGVIIANNF